jgi:hypothetical protein
MANRQRLYLVSSEDLRPDLIEGCREFCASLAGYLNEPVEFAVVGEARLKDIGSVLGKLSGVHSLDVIEPPPPINAPMSSAEFIWREDGRPDWSAMWTSFCDLALYGGPPHRGDDTALRAPAAPAPLDSSDPMIVEIRRGIWETAGLYAEPAEEPGWIAITCDSRKMAAWLTACIILENVDARCEDERLFVPASPEFTLKNEVKSVITVVAKTVHYWQAHIEAQEQAEAAAS